MRPRRGAGGIRRTEFAGWQSQAHATGLQDAVDKRWLLSRALRHRNLRGRTDAGVHAVARSSTSTNRGCTYGRALGSRYEYPAGPPTIALQWAAKSRGLHARHSARAPHVSLLHPELRAPASALQRLRSAGSAACSTRTPCIAPLGAHRRVRLLGLRSVECQSKSAQRESSGSRCAADGDWVWMQINGQRYLHTGAQQSSERWWMLSARLTRSVGAPHPGKPRPAAGRPDRARLRAVPVAGGVSAAVRDTCTACALFAKLTPIIHEQS